MPLSARALAIVARMAEIRIGDFVFPGQRRGRPLSGIAMGALVPGGATVHGFRSSFADWCSEVSSFPRELAEAALAHVSGDATQRAYRRGDALAKRRTLMEGWSTFCEPARAGNVVALRG